MDGQNANNLIEFGGFRLDTAKQILWYEESVVNLPLKSIELLSVLIENRGEVVTKDEILEKVWGESFVEESVLTQNIYLIRKTLKEKGEKNLIRNVPRRGYIFDGEIRLAPPDEPEMIAENPPLIPTENAETAAATVVESETAPPLRNEKSSAFSLFWRFRFPVIIGLIVFSSLMIGADFYLRGDSPSAAKTNLPPIRLKAVSVPSAVKSLAILPLKNADERFAASFSDDLSIRLGSFNKFDVKPSEFVRDAQKYDREIKTDFVLSGKLEAENNLFRAEIRLLDAKNGEQIRAEKFEFDNLIQLQDAIANQVSKEIQNRLTPEERELLAKRLPTNLAAYQNFRTGYKLWRKRGDGAAYFQKAIDLDQSFARAYIGLASHLMMIDSKAEAEELLQKAFELDDNLAEAYAVQGFMRIFHHRDWSGAEKSLKNALELDANNVNARHWLAVFYSLQRRLDEAETEMKTALELDPANPTLLGDLGQIYYFAGDKEAALDYCRQAIAIEPKHIFANHYMAEINNPRPKNQQQLLEEVIQLADQDQFTLPFINIDPRFDPVRGKDQFQTILRKINLISE